MSRDVGAREPYLPCAPCLKYGCHTEEGYPIFKYRPGCNWLGLNAQPQLVVSPGHTGVAGY
jgi:hypothetical protein